MFSNCRFRSKRRLHARLLRRRRGRGRRRHGHQPRVPRERPARDGGDHRGHPGRDRRGPLGDQGRVPGGSLQPRTPGSSTTWWACTSILPTTPSLSPSTRRARSRRNQRRTAPGPAQRKGRFIANYNIVKFAQYRACANSLARYAWSGAVPIFNTFLRLCLGKQESNFTGFPKGAKTYTLVERYNIRKNFQPRAHTVICSQHFVGGEC